MSTHAIDWTLPDYEEPQSIPTPADPTPEAIADAINEFVIDLYEHEGHRDFTIHYIFAASYIQRYEGAVKYLVEHPPVAEQMRKYTDLLLRTNPCILNTLFNMNHLLGRIGY
jgi:hypothetical protein